MLVERATMKRTPKPLWSIKKHRIEEMKRHLVSYCKKNPRWTPRMTKKTLNGLWKSCMRQIRHEPEKSELSLLWLPLYPQVMTTPGQTWITYILKSSPITKCAKKCFQQCKALLMLSQEIYSIWCTILHKSLSYLRPCNKRIALITNECFGAEHLVKKWKYIL